MSNQIIVPSLGESVTEATVSKWLKQVGEQVDSDEPLVELETDKVNVEVPSPLSGTLSSIKVKEGDTVEVGALLGVVNEGKTTSTKIKKTELSDQDQETKVIYDNLVAYRTKKAKEKKLPPYVIFHTKTIIELANLKPEDIKDLHKIYGLGTARIEEYGEDIIVIISGNIT